MVNQQASFQTGFQLYPHPKSSRVFQRCPVKRFAQISPLSQHKFCAVQQGLQDLLETTFAVSADVECLLQVAALRFLVILVALP